MSVPSKNKEAAPVGAVQSTARNNDQRRTLLALLASALGVFPLCQLFTDTGWLVDVWLSMLVVVGPAAALRRTRPASAGQIWIGVGLLVPWLTVNFVRAHAVAGILPFAGAWHDVGRLMTNLHHTTTDQAAPVHSTVAIRLALCALLGLIAALVDLLAVVGRRGALAGVPLLVVFTISGAVPRKPVSLLWFALAAAGFLILLALDSSDDLQRWGHYVPRPTRVGRRAANAVSGQRIAGAAIVLAIVLPIFIPADSRNFVANLFHSSRGDGGGFGANETGGGGTGGIDPFAALFGQLNRNKPIDLLTVKVSSDDPQFGHAKGDQPFYLRTNVLPIFSGDGWRPGQSGGLQSIDGTQYGSAPGTEFDPHVTQFNAQITVTGLTSNPPVFASPRAMDGLNSSTKWSTQDQLLVGSSISSGEVIQEDVAQPNPTLADLKAATQSDPAMTQWLKLPTIASYVRDLTTQITAAAKTPYERARAISDFFADPANGFSYSLSAPKGDSGDALTDFLRNRVGYCQQYAATMGVMLRLSGVPARVVLGYAHDVPDASGTFKVSTFDAHAWVEAYFAGIGWVPFDPTPITGISGGTPNDLAWAPHSKHSKPGGKQTATDPVVRPTGVQPGRDHPTKAATAAHRSGSAVSGVLLVVLIAVAVAVVVLLVPGFVRWRRRRRRIHRARHGDTDALWAELSATATDLGYVWSASRTPRQVATWLGGTSRTADSSLATLTRAVEQARYAPGQSDVGPELVHDLSAIEDGLRSRRTPRERFRATFWPASLDWSRVPVIGGWLPGSGDYRRH